MPTAATVFSWDLGIDGDIGNIRFSRSVPGLGLSGRCPMQLDFDIFDPQDSLIDSLAAPDFAITPSCDQLGENVLSPTFFVDSRSVSNSICHVVCYDRLSRADAPFTAEGAGWWTNGKMSGQNVMQRICQIIGFEGYLGYRSGVLDFIKFTKSDLKDKTCGELLDIISEVMVGVWTCNGNDLYFIPFGSTATTNIGISEHKEIEYQGKTAVIGLTMKNSSTGKTFSHGSVTGNGVVIQIENGFVSEYAANTVWQYIQNYQYTAWNCEKAVIPVDEFSFSGLWLLHSQVQDTESFGEFLFPRSVAYTVDSTGIYFSGGCPPCDEWNYKSKLEREKIGIGKAVGNAVITEGGDLVFINRNNEEGGGLNECDNGIGICVRNKNR